MKENISSRLSPWPKFVKRVAKSFAMMAAVVSIALVAGIVGYHMIAHLSWVDSLLNASMILTGMGPVDPMKDTAAKLFASAYALFSGVVFLSAVSIVLAPIFHRVVHAFHMDDDES